MEIQKVNQIEKASLKPLTLALTSADKTAINLSLKALKTSEGSPDYPVLFSIQKRLPQMQYGEAMKLLTVALTLAFETMNLSRPMKAAQIVDLADVVFDSSHEDNLSLEDVMLFLQGLTRGEYGKLYESMDIPKFMELFEVYREKRFQAIKNLRADQQIQYSTLPVNPRFSGLYKNYETE